MKTNDRDMISHKYLKYDISSEVDQKYICLISLHGRSLLYIDYFHGYV